MSDKSPSLAGPIAGPHLSKLAEAVANLSPTELIWASGFLFGLAQSTGGSLRVQLLRRLSQRNQPVV